MPRSENHFERLGLPRRFAIDGNELERLYLVQSRNIHPDFHSQSSSGEQSASESGTASLNEAYRVLKDPFQRADYLLSLLNGPTASEMKDIPQMFLMEMLELREEIEAARQKQDSSKLDQLETRIDTEYQTKLNTIAEQFTTIETQEHVDPPMLSAIRQELNAAKYLRGLLRDLLAD